MDATAKEEEAAQAPTRGEGVWTFAGFRFDGRRLELFRNEERVPLRATPARLLLHLLHHRERFVPREELLRAVWGEAVVSASALRSALKELRSALGDSGERQRFIETRRGVGLRFAGPAERTSTAGRTPPPRATQDGSAEGPLAKLSPPDAAGLVPRPRLFARLDAAPPAVWLTGPAGSGKTALLASYLAEGGRTSAWLQLDARDGDPAFFFHYAARLGRRLGASLPRYSADSPRGLSVFARTFFEQLYAAAGTPFTLVLDDLHEVPPQAAWWQVLPSLVALVPSGSRLLLASRAPPPAPLARARITGRLDELGWKELAPTVEEVAAIARRRSPAALSKRDLAALAERAAGWMGGLVLCLEGGSPTAPEDSGERLAFDFLASEVLAGAPEADREILLAAAHAPSVTPALANEVAGRGDAERVLEDWSARSAFVVRLAAPEPTYRLHPLLREQLRVEAQERLAPEELRGRLERAGAHLADRGAPDDAAELFLEAGAWERLDALLRRHAPALRESGRDATLHGWLRQVPETVVRQRPWLALWRGASGLPAEEPHARDDLARAFAALEAAGDGLGAALALAEILDAFWLEFDSLRGLDAWIPALERILERGDALAPPARMRLESAAYRILHHRAGEHPLLPGLRDRLEAAVVAASGTDVSLPACLSLSFVELWRSGPATAEPFIRRIEAIDPEDPLLQVQLDLPRIIFAWCTRRGRRAATLGIRSADVAERLGAFSLAAQALLQAGHGWLAAGSPTEALRTTRRARSLTGAGARSLLDANIRFLEAWIAAIEGAWSEARRSIREARRQVAGRGWGPPEALLHLLEAQVAHELGEARAAGEALSQGRTIGRALASEPLLALVGLVESDLAFADGGREDGRRALRDALGRGRRSGHLFFLGQLPPLMRRQCERARELGIEPQFAGTLLRLEEEAARPRPPPP